MSQTLHCSLTRTSLQVANYRSNADHNDYDLLACTLGISGVVNMEQTEGRLT